MGYSLTIGNAVLDYDPDPEWPYLAIRAEGVTHTNAPAYGEPTDYTNERWPSYSSWHSFAREVNLHDMMFGDTTKEWNNGSPLIREHPGHTIITEKHRQKINRVFEYKSIICKREGKIPGYKYTDLWGKVEKLNPEQYDPELARLTWLHYWVNWALDNCKIPVFVNT